MYIWRMRSEGLRTYGLVALMGLCLFLPYLGKAHLFDWDEINFAEAAREMVVTGNYSTVQINFQPFWEKPPLFIWLQAASFNAFGVNDYAARLPNALVGVAMLCTLLWVHKRNGNVTAGWWSALLFVGSYLSHFYSKSALIDPLFNLLMFTSVVFLARYFDTRRFNAIAISGVLAGLAVLTKGPVAILVIGATWVVYLLWKRAWHKRLPLAVALWLVCCGLVATVWFGFIAWKEGWWLVVQFILYQIRLLSTPDAGHGGFLLYHWVVLLVGMFPASIFFVAWFFDRKRKRLRDEPTSFGTLALISFWVVLVLFTIVKTKIVHYSSYCYLPMCFIGGKYLSQKEFTFKSLQRWMKWILTLVVALVAAAIAGLIYVARNPTTVTSYIHDAFAQASLNALVDWPAWLYALPLAMVVAAVVVLFFNADTGLKQAGYLLALNAVWLELLMVFVVPRVEAHSQGAAIEFYENLQNQNCDVIVYGYKSYAQLFYARKQPAKVDTENLLLQPVTRPLFVVTRIDRNEGLSSYPDLELMYRRNGFEFYRKLPK